MSSESQVALRMNSLPPFSVASSVYLLSAVSKTYTLWSSFMQPAIRYLPECENWRASMPLANPCFFSVSFWPVTASQMISEGRGFWSPVATVFLFGCSAMARMSSSCPMSSLCVLDLGWCAMPTAAA